MFVGEITDLQTSQKVVRSITHHRSPILCDHAKTPKNCQLLSGVVSTLQMGLLCRIGITCHMGVKSRLAIFLIFLQDVKHN